MQKQAELVNSDQGVNTDNLLFILRSTLACAVAAEEIFCRDDNSCVIRIFFMDAGIFEQIWMPISPDLSMISLAGQSSMGAIQLSNAC